MLSERERQTLREIEQQFLNEDPKLAAALRRSLPGGRSSAARRAHDVVIGLAVLLALVCFATMQATALPGVAAALFAGVVGYLRWQRFGFRPNRRSGQ
ncbi:MAG TPA: DUF3040 domain-containing protein [Pseudonocardiaceae bacterium]|jgi:Flp pilus assembly protein TadB